MASWVYVETNRRSYCARGGARVEWSAGERVVRIEALTEADLEYGAYLHRAAELEARIAGGESIDDIMRAEQLARGQALIARAIAQDEADNA
jgi:hypothetical protein